MRVTEQQLTTLFQQQLQQRQRVIADSQEAIASGQRPISPATDPVAWSGREVIRAASDQLDRFDRSIGVVQARLQHSEAAIDSSINALLRARELALTAANAATSVQDYTAIAAEIAQLHDSVRADANQRGSDGQFLFAGSYSATEPFVTDANGVVSYQGNNARIAVQVAPGSTVDSNLTGADVYARTNARDGGDSDADAATSIFSSLHQFEAQLLDTVAAGSRPENWQQSMQTALQNIDDAHRHLVLQRSQVGLNLQQLESHASHNATTQEHLQQRLSKISDLDYAATISALQQQLIALEAVQKTAMQTMQMSLFKLLP